MSLFNYTAIKLFILNWIQNYISVPYAKQINHPNLIHYQYWTVKDSSTVIRNWLKNTYSTHITSYENTYIPHLLWKHIHTSLVMKTHPRLTCNEKHIHTPLVMKTHPHFTCYENTSTPHLLRKTHRHFTCYENTSTHHLLWKI